MTRMGCALFLVAAVTLLLELALMRVFDVILTTNLGYMVITCAMFSLGLSGVYTALRPPPTDPRRFLAACSALFGLATLALLPALNALPFEFKLIGEQPLRQLVAFGLLYLALIAPFFMAGLIFSTLFSTYASQIRPLYFADLTGAAVGCLVLVPFIPWIGPGGLLICGAGAAFVASALFADRRGLALGAATAALILVALPFARAPEYFEFREHADKRGVRTARETGVVERSIWDPISKIDIVPVDDEQVGTYKHVAYDGGQQSSRFTPFDGDFARLRQRIEQDISWVSRHFWNRGVLASHYLKRNRAATVLIIGSAGGQETKAALLYDPGHVDTIEMVGTVVRLATTTYADEIGRIFNDPRVHPRHGEGRSFLRSTDREYDVIQIFSNHTSSSIASGSGAMSSVYLQTVEAYQEYFEHLAPDGILQINHHVYPRMVATASRAWADLGRRDFRSHVVVFHREVEFDTIPTMLVKMSPWTPTELAELQEFFGRETPWAVDRHRMVENPLAPGGSFLPDAFYAGRLPPDVRARSGYWVHEPTDDRPFFNFLRKTRSPIEPDASRYLNSSVASNLNLSLRHGIPLDWVHFIGTGIAAMFFTVVFVFVPLLFSEAGRADWSGRSSTLVYFSCLGAGFIIAELVLIQIFMKLIGYPLHAYSTVLFTMLLGAGLGSLSGDALGITPSRRWQLPFLGVFASGLLLWLIHPTWFALFLGTDTPVRIGASVALILPFGFFLGMPFPLGILTIQNGPRGAIAWAWGMNGLFTVVGGVGSVLLSIFLGFRVTLALSLAIYLLAFLTFARLRVSADA